MKIRIQFPPEANYHEKDLTLLLMRYFTPTKFSVLKNAWDRKGPEIYMEGAAPVNPFDVMKEINEAIGRKAKDWSYHSDITYIELESPEEKDKIPTWILVDKIDPGV